jgi:hypothetical protein
MRRIKKKERKRAGNIYCDHCKPEKVDAVWRKDGFATHNGDYACEDHKHLIQDEHDNGHRTEADFQTWMRL